MIDYQALREHIRFSLEHYGTRTQGEAHRFDQVATHITEIVERLNDLNSAVQESQAWVG